MLGASERPGAWCWSQALYNLVQRGCGLHFSAPDLSSPLSCSPGCFSTPAASPRAISAPSVRSVRRPAWESPVACPFSSGSLCTCFLPPHSPLLTHPPHSPGFRAVERASPGRGPAASQEGHGLLVLQRGGGKQRGGGGEQRRALRGEQRYPQGPVWACPGEGQASPLLAGGPWLSLLVRFPFSSLEHRVWAGVPGPPPGASTRHPSPTAGRRPVEGRELLLPLHLRPAAGGTWG